MNLMKGRKRSDETIIVVIIEKGNIYSKHFHKGLFESAIRFLLGFFVDIATMLVEVVDQLNEHGGHYESFFLLGFLIITVAQRQVNIQ